VLIDTCKKILFVGVLIFVFILATVSQESAVLTTGWDKLNHLAAFFVLLGLFDYAYPAMPLWPRQCLWLMVYGLLIECAQGLTIDRDFSLFDIVADTLGLLFYSLVRPWLIRFLPYSKAADYR
jgi:VanZ family protein